MIKMAKRDRFRLPVGMAGLIRYPEETKDQLKVKPKYVIAFCLVLALIELLLKIMAVI